MNDTLKNSVYASLFVAFLYCWYTGGNALINRTWPDGYLLSAVIGVVGLIFGYAVGNIVGKKK